MAILLAWLRQKQMKDDLMKEPLFICECLCFVETVVVRRMIFFHTDLCHITVLAEKILALKRPLKSQTCSILSAKLKSTHSTQQQQLPSTGVNMLASRSASPFFSTFLLMFFGHIPAASCKTRETFSLRVAPSIRLAAASTSLACFALLLATRKSRGEKLQPLQLQNLVLSSTISSQM